MLIISSGEGRGMSGVVTIIKLYKQLQAIGHGHSGTQALIHAIRRI